MGDTRSRSRGSLTGARTIWQCINSSCANIGVTQTLGGPFFVEAYAGTIEAITDVVTRGYHRLSQQGFIINNPYARERKTFTCSGTFLRWKYNGQSCGNPVAFTEEWIDGPYALKACTGQTTQTPTAVFSASEIQALISVASSKAWSNANQHDANVLQDAAESRQLAKLLISPKTTAQKIIAAAVKTRGKSVLSGAKSLGKSSLDLASDLWLQYQYGIKPLVSTLNGVVDAMARYRKRHRWTARGNVSLSRTKVTSGSSAYWVADIFWTRTDVHEVKVRAGILLEEEVKLTNNLGVDASGMLSLPWELIPFSFVADWFINVGDFISSIVPFTTKTPLATWYTIEETITSTFTVTGNGAPKGAWTIVRGASGTFSGSLQSKKRLVPLPGPSIAFKPDSPLQVLADKRALDSAALVFQRLGRVFKG
jgi:hypothetical protein